MNRDLVVKFTVNRELKDINIVVPGKLLEFGILGLYAGIEVPENKFGIKICNLDPHLELFIVLLHDLR